MRRIVVVLGIAALVAAIVAGPVAAQATQNRTEFEGPFDFNVFNPCNNDEFVHVTGQVRGFTLEVDTPTDQANAKIHVEVTGTGEGTLGNSYVFSDTQNQQFKEGPPTTFLLPSHLISQGSDDNFVLTARYRLTGNGEYEFDGLMGTQCRG
jgi:hypothetical protein